MSLTRLGVVLLAAMPWTASCSDACDGCRIDEHCYDDGESAPDNPCRICDATRAPDKWSVRDGPCDDGSFCTIDDTCASGRCLGAQRVCDDGIDCNGVEVCDEEGDVCASGDDQCGDGMVCNPEAGQCVLRCHHCSIDGACYFNNERHPTNPCQVCDDARDAFDWSNRDDAPCDDGLFCNGADVCAGGACAAHAGDPCPDELLCNGAESCDEALDLCLHSNDACPPGDSCQENGAGVACCAPHDHLACNAGGDVAWIDSCGQEVGIAVDCASAPHGACAVDACICLEGRAQPPGCERCVIFVNHVDGDDADDGSTWALAKATVQAGIAAAATGGCQVWVAEGIYLTTTATDRSLSFQMVPGVDLYGGFAGTETSPDQRDLASYETVLSGEIGDPADTLDNARRVVIGADNTVFDGFRVTGASNDLDIGAGYYAIQAAVTLRNSTFTGNRSWDDGGGVFIGQSASAAVEHCAFVGNRARAGAGLCISESSVVVSDCRFEGNRAMVYGGGAYLAAGPRALLRSLTFATNSGDRGGGLAVTSGAGVVCSNCVFRGNSARSGGGFYAEGQTSTAMLNNPVFVANAAQNDGGGAAVEDGTVALRNATMVGNVAAATSNASGGGIFTADAAALTIAGCLLWDNLATGAAADQQQIRFRENRPWVRFSTVAGDTVYPGERNSNSDPLLSRSPLFWDGALWMIDEATIRVTDETLYTIGDVIELQNDGVPHTVVSVATGEVTFTPSLAARLLEAVAVAYWGPGATDLAVDVSLAPGSPAIDAGWASTMLADGADLDGDGDTGEPTPLDVAGNPRVQGSEVDVGAYEHAAL